MNITRIVSFVRTRAFTVSKNKIKNLNILITHLFDLSPFKNIFKINEKVAHFCNILQYKIFTLRYIINKTNDFLVYLSKTFIKLIHVNHKFFDPYKIRISEYSIYIHKNVCSHNECVIYPGINFPFTLLKKPFLRKI